MPPCTPKNRSLEIKERLGNWKGRIFPLVFFLNVWLKRNFWFTFFCGERFLYHDLIMLYYCPKLFLSKSITIIIRFQLHDLVLSPSTILQYFPACNSSCQHSEPSECQQRVLECRWQSLPAKPGASGLLGFTGSIISITMASRSSGLYCQRHSHLSEVFRAFKYWFDSTLSYLREPLQHYPSGFIK